MEVAQQVHGLSAPFGPQLSVELVCALLLVGRLICHGVAGKAGGTFMSTVGEGYPPFRNIFVGFVFVCFFSTCLSR